MEDKQDNTLIELDNFDDYLNQLESEAYEYYDKHIEQFGKVKIQMIQKSVSLDKSTIEECKETLKKIAKYNEIIENILNEEILDYAVNQNKFDSVKARFDDRNKLLLGMKNTFEKSIFRINLRIEEFKDMPQQKPATSNEVKKGFDLDFKQAFIEPASAPVENNNLVLFQREIALIYWYDKAILSIDLNNSQQIAETHGYKSKTSGRSIYNDHYTKVRDKPEERTDNDTSEKYLNNIIPRLTTERGKREANEDLTKAKYLKENKKKGLFY